MIKSIKNVDKTIKKRWTPALLEDGFTPVSTFFLDNYAALGMTSAEVVFILHLMRYKWDHQNPFPRFEKLAERTGLSYSSVRTQARGLENKGLLKRVRRRGYVEFDLTPLFKRFEALKIENEAV